MPAADGGRRWTEEEERYLRARWRDLLGRGFQTKRVIRCIAAGLRRSYGSVYGHAVLAGLPTTGNQQP